MNNDKEDKFHKKNTLEKRLLYDKLTFFYISLPLLLLGNFMGALLLSAIQLEVIQQESIIIWLTLSFIIFLYGFYLYSLFRNETENNKLKHVNLWLDKYYTNVLVYGIIWGSSAFLMFPEANLLNQMVVIFFLFAIGFTSMGILASKPDLLITYIMVTYIPMILRLFFMESAQYSIIAYIVLFLVLVMFFIANYYGKIINNSLENRQNFITIKDSHLKLKERFFSLFERAPVGIFYYNDQLEIEDVNMHFMLMHGIEDKEIMLGMNLQGFANKQVIQAHKDVFYSKTGNYRGPFGSFKNKDLYVKLSTVPMLNTKGEVAGGITIVNDITKEITIQEEMIRTAYYDLLTDIPNKTLLMDKLSEFLKASYHTQQYASLLFLDVDNFKKVNESYGHNVGDHLLKQIAKKLEDILGEHEIFARVGGDKFALLIPSLSEKKDEAKQQVLRYIQTMYTQFEKPLLISGDTYHVSFSIGVMLFKQERSAFDLLKSAETAMYEAKQTTKGSIQFYESRMSEATKEILTIENDIHKAIQNYEFFIDYQPQIDIYENKIIGAESLVRWKHPTKGLISPSKFIPIAEESGIIIKLEEYIFHAIFKNIKSLFESNEGKNLQHISINVSTIHFLQPNFVDKIMQLVQQYKIQPEWIEFEITESGLMRNINDAIKKIKDLKNFGFTFSIDDFGTGYSSLSYLKELPVDTIKIDQSFILHMHKNKGDAMIVESVVSIGKKFNLKIVAEGVETIEALDYLKKIQCTTYQGYFGYKPMSLDDFRSIL